MRQVQITLATALLAGCAGRYIRPTTSEVVERTEARVERGRYLVDNVASCGACHTGRPSGNLFDGESTDLYLSGGNEFVEPALGARVWVSNLTPHVTGIGTWTDDELMRGIRDGVRKDGSFMLPFMPYSAYQYISDEDVRAIVAYLRTLPPLDPVKPRFPNEVPFIVNFAVNLGLMMHKPAVNVPHPDPSDRLAYGRYLARLGHCGECHALGGRGPRDENDRYMAGSDQAFDLGSLGKVWASNLTPDVETGIGRYTNDQLKESLRTGKRLDGKAMAPPMSLFIPHLSGMTDEDLDALVTWLKSLPPVKNKLPERELTAEGRKYVGEG